MYGLNRRHCSYRERVDEYLPPENWNQSSTVFSSAIHKDARFYYIFFRYPIKSIFDNCWFVWSWEPQIGLQNYAELCYAQIRYSAVRSTVLPNAQLNLHNWLVTLRHIMLNEIICSPIRLLYWALGYIELNYSGLSYLASRHIGLHYSGLLYLALRHIALNHSGLSSLALRHTALHYSGLSNFVLRHTALHWVLSFTS